MTGDERADVPDRFADRVRVDADGCWIWTGSTDGGKGGYGRTWFRSGYTSSHRAMWVTMRGPIPDGMEIDHLCRVRLCCNPEHLEVVTRQENYRRQVQARTLPTDCKHGHEYTPENTLQRERGARRCRECSRQKSLGYLKRRREAS